MIASPGAVTVIRPVVGGGGLAESRRTESTATTGGTTIGGGGTAATEDSAFTGGGGGCTVRDGAKKRIPTAINASAAAPTPHGVAFDRQGNVIVSEWSKFGRMHLFTLHR